MTDPAAEDASPASQPSPLTATTPAAAEATAAAPPGEPISRSRPAWAIVGACLFLVIGLAMLVPAIHLATEPILLPSATGPSFDCGTAIRPPTKPFPVKVCGAEPKRYQQQAVAWAIAAVIVGGGGALAFLLPTRVRTARHGRRRAPDPLDAEDF